MSQLCARHLRKSYQGREVVRDVSLEVASGEVVGLLGPNGAGKTTCFYMIVGLVSCDDGEIQLDANSIVDLPIHRRAHLGLSYLPQEPSVFRKLTVEENILIPVWVSPSLVPQERLALVYQVLPELIEMKDRRAMLLSGGQQKLVALARALAVGTRLLLLDEPFEGVAPALSKRLAEVIAGLKGTEVSVLIAQSDLNHSRKLVDREFAIERGANLAAQVS
jgi:branched-chain amino acid transport system ATP-binding protein